MNRDLEGGLEALKNAEQAFRQGNRREARRWAEQAAVLAAEREEPWLWLAAVSSPRASLFYLTKALEINPQSRAARRGMHWALRQQRSVGTAASRRRKIVDPSIPSESLVRTRHPSQEHLPWAAAVTLLLAVLVWFSLPVDTRSGVTGVLANWAIINRIDPVALAQGNLSKATRTPTPTFTPTPTPTFTPTLTFTPSPSPTETPTETPAPTDTPYPTEEPPPIPEMPEVGRSEHWIDVNLSTQSAHAFRGKELVRSFTVSTGTWQHPTVTGQFQIYVKYRYADMSGPGYYLPDVPYVMYFYEGYGLHGTYWHSNFGTPMSHGCVNFTIDDAGWIFEFVDVGTLVNVHY
jgi:lipoprotein-anchoring transpeptidase ErfK/SrfK